MKRHFWVLLLVGLFWPILTVSAEQRPELLYFFENYCASCEPEQEFMEAFYRQTGESATEYQCAFYNLRFQSARDAYSRAVETYGLTEEQQKLPLLIWKGTIYAGTEAIQSLPTQSVLEVDGSMVYYLYVPACASCAIAEEVLKSLPETVNVGGKDYPVTVRKVDISQETALALSLFQACRIPETERVAPLAIVGSQYFSGHEAIQTGLKTALLSGQGISTAAAEVISEPEASSFSFPAAALSGLVGGLNPCALSMLLLFCMLVLSAGKQAAGCTAAFLSAKLVTYLLIGTVLLKFLQVWNPTWLPKTLKILMTVACIVFIILNLNDAAMASKEKYGKMRNQLPVGIRRFLNDKIRAVMRHPKRLLPATALLGVVVAASEFLCAGQVYLATLLSVIQRGEAPLRSFMLLCVYCIAFLTPSAVVSVLLIRGRSALAVSEWLRRRLPLIKGITAIFFALLLATLWL